MSDSALVKLRTGNYVEASQEEASKRIRKAAHDKYLAKKPIRDISIELTRDVMAYLHEKLQGEAFQSLTRAFTGPYAVMLPGTASRGEMAPYSDLDFAVVCEKESDKGAAEALGRQVATLRGGVAGFGNADPAVQGLYGMTMVELITQGAAGIDLVVAAGDPSMFELFRQLYLQRRGEDALLASVQNAQRDRYAAIFGNRASLTADKATNRGWPGTDISVKNKLLRYLITTMAAVAALEQKAEFGEKVPAKLPMTTMERILWFSDKKDPPTCKKLKPLWDALKKDKLSDGLVADFQCMLELRYRLHFETGRETDEFTVGAAIGTWTPDKEFTDSVTQWLDDALPRFKKFGDALAGVK